MYVYIHIHIIVTKPRCHNCPENSSGPRRFQLGPCAADAEVRTQAPAFDEYVLVLSGEVRINLALCNPLKPVFIFPKVPGGRC